MKEVSFYSVAPRWPYYKTTSIGNRYCWIGNVDLLQWWWQWWLEWWCRVCLWHKAWPCRWGHHCHLNGKTGGSYGLQTGWCGLNRCMLLMWQWTAGTQQSSIGGDPWHTLTTKWITKFVNCNSFHVITQFPHLSCIHVLTRGWNFLFTPVNG